MYGKSSSSSLVSIPNEVRTDLWLSSTSDAEKSVRLYVGFPGSECFLTYGYYKLQRVKNWKQNYCDTLLRNM